MRLYTLILASVLSMVSVGSLEGGKCRDTSVISTPGGGRLLIATRLSSVMATTKKTPRTSCLVAFRQEVPTGPWGSGKLVACAEEGEVIDSHALTTTHGGGVVMAFTISYGSLVISESRDGGRSFRPMSEIDHETLHHPTIRVQLFGAMPSASSETAFHLSAQVSRSLMFDRGFFSACEVVTLHSNFSISVDQLDAWLCVAPMISEVDKDDHKKVVYSNWAGWGYDVWGAYCIDDRSRNRPCDLPLVMENAHPPVFGCPTRVIHEGNKKGNKQRNKQ